jgi:O-antigen/teichoic acid export membrane protein
LARVAADHGYRRFVGDAFRYLPMTLLRAGSSLVGLIIFSRIFTAAVYGRYSLVTAAIGVLVPLMGEWGAQGVGRFHAEHVPGPLEDAYRSAVAQLASRMGLLAALLGGVGALSVWVLTGGAWPLSLLCAGGAVVVLQSMAVIISPMLPAGFRTSAYRNYTVATGVGALLSGLALVWLFGRQVAWLAWGTAFASLLLMPYLYRHAGIRWERPALGLSDAVQAIIRRFWRYGAPLTIWFVLSHILYNSDRYVIQAFWGAAQVGVYSVNYNLVNRSLGFATAPLNTAAWPVLMRQWADGQRDMVRATVRRMTETYGLVGVGLVGLVAAVGEPATRIVLGPAFRSGYIILAPVLGGLVLRAGANLGTKSLEFHEKTGWMVWNSAAAAAVNLGLNLWWVRAYGYPAAAWAALVGFSVYTVLTWWEARRLLPWDVPWRPLLALVVAAAVGWWLAVRAEANPVLAHSPWTRLGAGVLVFAAAYGAVAWAVARRRSTASLGR